jgi:probable selenium-dependent hydroxylase accessory protein YqeC
MAALNLSARELIATVGGGGKTTFGLRLAETASGEGKCVISTTTTKVRYEEGLSYPRLIQVPLGTRAVEAAEKVIDGSCALFLARGRHASGKLSGILPQEADRLFTESKADYVIVEADGAAGLPVKAPAAKEPVIPSATTTVVALIGLEALGRPLAPQWVFRVEAFERLTGLTRGQAINATAILNIFQSPEGLYKGAPTSAMKIAFMNKCDRCTDLREARRIGAMLIQHSPGGVERVVIGSLEKGIYETIS